MSEDWFNEDELVIQTDLLVEEEMYDYICSRLSSISYFNKERTIVLVPIALMKGLGVEFDEFYLIGEDTVLLEKNKILELEDKIRRFLNDPDWKIT